MVKHSQGGWRMSLDLVLAVVVLMLIILNGLLGVIIVAATVQEMAAALVR